MCDQSSDTCGRGVVVACTLFAAVVPFLASLVYFVLLAGSRIAVVVYSIAKLFTVLWPFLAVRYVERSSIDIVSAPGAAHRRSLWVGLGVGLVFAAIIAGGYFLTPLGDYARDHANHLTAKLVDLRIDAPLRFVAFGIFLAVFHSAIEEWYWRWYLYRRMVRIVPAWAAHTMAATAFSLHHFVILGCYFSAVGAIGFGSATLIAGIVWSVMYQRAGSLAGAWLSHAMADAAILVAGYHIAFASPPV